MGKAAPKSVALTVVRRLRSAGYTALFAGGCVRDMLLGHPSHDYDVATDAAPLEVKKLFRHVLLVGAKFGVAMVIENKRKVEVTTFRSDIGYSDGRRPDSIKFSSPIEDAKRRDFTINGIFYDPISHEVIDYVDGQKDLKRGIVRTIGSPDQRFAEDYLRMIRAVRFAIRFEFELDSDTAEAIKKFAPKIKSISGERIFDELSKMLSLDSAAHSLELLEQLSLAKQILPELLGHSKWVEAVGRVRYVARYKDVWLSMAGLLCALDKQHIVRICRRWGASNELRNAITWIAHHLNDWPSANDWQLSRFKKVAAGEHFRRLRKLWRFEELRHSGTQTQSRRIALRLRSIDPAQLKPAPFIGGSDLIAMGLKPGPLMGKVIHSVYDAQLDHEVKNKKQALKLAVKMIEANENSR